MSRALITGITGQALGTLRVLEAIRILGLRERTRFYQASTSEMFGKVQDVPQRETTPFYPRSPYGAAKVYAYWITVNYREAYGLFSLQRDPLQPRVPDPRRDLRDAQDYARTGAHQSGTGGLPVPREPGFIARLGPRPRLRARPVADAAAEHAGGLRDRDRRAAFGVRVRRAGGSALLLGMRLEWQGDGVEERGIDAKSGRTIIKIDPRYFRPTEVETLLGDSSKALQELGWRPEIDFQTLIAEMIAQDLDLARRDAVMAREGFKTYQYRE